MTPRRSLPDRQTTNQDRYRIGRSSPIGSISPWLGESGCIYMSEQQRRATGSFNFRFISAISFFLPSPQFQLFFLILTLPCPLFSSLSNTSSDGVVIHQALNLKILLEDKTYYFLFTKGAVMIPLVLHWPDHIQNTLFSPGLYLWKQNL